MASSTNSTTNYTSIHNSDHQQYSAFNFTTEAQWDSLNNHEHTPIQKDTATKRSSYKVFGWHPYYKGSAYKSYDFSTLWGISYFGYNLDPNTGSYTNIHQWKTTAMVDSAHHHNTNVFLTVTNFGAKNNSTFLKNESAQQTLVDSLHQLLQLRKAHGVNIDFEGVAKNEHTHFSNFIKLLSTQLKAKNKSYLVSVCLYAVDRNQVFDIKTLNPYIDLYQLMAYDYYGGFSSMAGPVAPLHSSSTFGKLSVSNSVNYYLKQGIEKSKLIVGVPYYGASWNTETASIPSKVLKFDRHWSYSKMKGLENSLSLPLSYDSISSTRYSLYKSTAEQQYWFDDSLSLANRYHWIKQEQLGGVGIWALGYDNGYIELWKLLQTSFKTK